MERTDSDKNRHIKYSRLMRKKKSYDYSITSYANRIQYADNRKKKQQKKR